MKNDKYIGAAGAEIIRIDFSELEHPVTRLSEFSDNWEIPSKCPECGRDIYFTKHNVNKLIVCKCGKQLYLEIHEKLL